MRKEFEFTVRNHKIRIVKFWNRGCKLYVDGDFRDQDTSILAFGKTALLSAKLADCGILEIFPNSAFISVEMDAFLFNDNEKLHVYSSHKRLSLREQRLSK